MEHAGNGTKCILAGLVLLAALSAGCKKQEYFRDPEFILHRWARATETLNYTDYRKSEAFPKSEQSFREIYRDTYLADPVVLRIEELDSKKVKQDFSGNSYVKRNVQFECSEILRKSRRSVQLLKGDVDFIKFTDGPKVKDGWLMHNRNIIRTRT